VLAALAASVALAASSCPSNLAASLPTGSATQLVTVAAARQRTTTAAVVLWRKTGGCWQRAAGPWTARIGRSGLSTHHREGDGTTPVGAFGFGSVMYGIAANPGVHFRYHRLACGDWWDEDPESPTYNTFRHVACGTTPPFGGDSEALWRQTRAYRHFAVIAYNTRPVVAGRGSAMFLHEDTGAPTNGCVSLPPTRLVALLRWLRPAASPRIAIGTRAELAGF
jgi:L,D-peptidoglycan transpeptidase YkuD (ErfK/YbiS/YcfS/YnhG family)